MQIALAVGLGGALGAVLRWSIANKLNVAEIPWGTWLVNLIGCFLIGVLYVYVSQRAVPMAVQYGLIAGLLGGFTTFSAYSLEVVRLIESGHMSWAIIYALGTCLSCVFATFGGVAVARVL